MCRCVDVASILAGTQSHCWSTGASPAAVRLEGIVEFSASDVLCPDGQGIRSVRSVVKELQLAVPSRSITPAAQYTFNIQSNVVTSREIDPGSNMFGTTRIDNEDRTPLPTTSQLRQRQARVVAPVRIDNT